MRALIVAAGIIASAVSSATAWAEDVDWKEIGVATVGGEIVVCFYDTVSIIYAGSHTRVWVKCIRQQDVEDTIADKGVLGKKIVDNAGGKSSQDTSHRSWRLAASTLSKASRS